MLSSDSLPTLSVPVLLLLAGSTIAYLLSLVARRPAFPSSAPALIVDNVPLLGALQFWTARRDFFAHHGSKSPSGNFSYYIGKHRVVGLTGEANRKVFFESKDLGFAEGYAVLFGQSPDSARVQADINAGKQGLAQHFAKRLVHLLRTERLKQCLPHLISDTRATLDEIAQSASGITDPFESIYKVVFQMTMRMVGSQEIASDRILREKMLDLFETVEHSATATTIIFPQLPTLAWFKRTYAGGRIYMMLNKIIQDRTKTGKREEDALQYLMDLGDDTTSVLTFVIGALFAGQLNSGINAGYMMVYLTRNPTWLRRVREEVETVAARHCSDASLPLADKLTHVPLEAWESEFQAIDICLRECIRLQLLGAAIRRNVSGKDVKVGNEIIPNGAFATYHVADIHRDPSVYSNPNEWDPSRYLPDRAEDSQKPLTFVGWGAGRHPCLGMRFAKLEQNIITAFFAAYFDFDLCTKEGQPTSTFPVTDINSWTAVKPNPPVYLKCIGRKD